MELAIRWRLRSLLFLHHLHGLSPYIGLTMSRSAALSLLRQCPAGASPLVARQSTAHGPVRALAARRVGSKFYSSLQNGNEVKKVDGTNKGEKRAEGESSNGNGNGSGRTSGTQLSPLPHPLPYSYSYPASATPIPSANPGNPGAGAFPFVLMFDS